MTSTVAPTTERITQVTLDDVPALAAGAAILGTGGGGSVFAAELAVKASLEANGPVRVVSVDELTDDDVVILMSGIGAPTVGVEMLSSREQVPTLLREAEKLLGRRITTLMAAEIGGSNGLSPVGWAARLGLQVLDADGMGRAYPESDMMAMNIAGVPCRFAVMCDAIGNVVALHSVDLAWLERHARAITIASGTICMGAHYPMTADEVRGAVIEGTVSQAVRVGRAVLTSPDPVAGLADALGAEVLIHGKVSDVDRRTERGFAIGAVTITGTGLDRGRQQVLEVQNENLVVREYGGVVVSAPDLISIVDAETGQAISTELVRFGQRVAVLAWPCDPLWRTPRGLELAGPARFGYDFPYTPFAPGRAR